MVWRHAFNQLVRSDTQPAMTLRKPRHGHVPHANARQHRRGGLSTAVSICFGLLSTPGAPPAYLDSKTKQVVDGMFPSCGFRNYHDRRCARVHFVLRQRGHVSTRIDNSLCSRLSRCLLVERRADHLEQGRVLAK